MIKTVNIQSSGKPFIKWAGGKSQLLGTIDAYLPKHFSTTKHITYIEPFIGGGAVLFHILRTYPNIDHAVINDINPHLTNAYRAVKHNPGQLIELLSEIDADYKRTDDYDTRKAYYMDMRRRFNSSGLTPLEDAAILIFLNRTCFNGLYRENSKGGFNVPFGRYPNPTICDKDLIAADSLLLQKVEILQGDFYRTIDYIDGYTFFYFDPPYRPLDATSNFNTYVKEVFDDNEQRRLMQFFKELSQRGIKALLSNSDGRARNPDNVFFDTLYSEFIIERVEAKRSINANPSKRGAITELLIRNYPEYQGQNTPTQTPYTWNLNLPFSSTLSKRHISL